MRIPSLIPIPAIIGFNAIHLGSINLTFVFEQSLIAILSIIGLRTYKNIRQRIINRRKIKQ